MPSGQYKQNAPQTLIIETREAMIAEAKGIVDAARARGLVLRVLGGLAARLHCRSLDFCERDHGDIDLIGHRRDRRQIGDLFTELGYRENPHVREATEGRQLQYVRECRHGEGWSEHRPHAEDHVDVFLDTFKMDHAIDLNDRLELDDYTITPTDTLLVKLQMAHVEEKDERDIFTLLKDLPMRGADAAAAAAAGSDQPEPPQPPGPVIDVPYLAGRCAQDWGLFHEVELNLARLQERLAAYDIEPQGRERVRGALTGLEMAIRAEPKSAAWRLRARLGTHVHWHDLVEEQD